MDQSDINNAIKKVWTEELKKKKESLTDSIIENYADWVRNLVKQAAEQQAVQNQQVQSAQQPGQQDKADLSQGGVKI